MKVMFLLKQLRKEFISFLEKQWGLNERIIDPKNRQAFRKYGAGHSLLAKELQDRASREDFLTAFWQAIQENTFTNVDWKQLEEWHEGGGAFMSEIVIEEVTWPCVFAITTLVALRDRMPGHSRDEVDAHLGKLISFFGDISWGHGIEYAYTVREYVRWFAMAGAFPLEQDLGYLKPFEPIYKRLLGGSTESGGWGPDLISILEMQVLLRALNREQVEKIPKSTLTLVEEKAPQLLWLINGVIPARAILSMIDSQKINFSPNQYPWHVVKLSATKKEIDELTEVAKNVLLEKKSSGLVALLLKMDGLERFKNE